MAVTYNVYRDGTKVKSGLTTKSYEDTGLTPNTKYEYQVSAVENGKESPKSNKITVTTNYSDVTSVKVTPTTKSIDVGKTTTLSATVEPSTAKQGVDWSSDKKAIATVDANGKVIAVA